MSHIVFQQLVERVHKDKQFAYRCAEDEAKLLRQRFYDWRKALRRGETGVDAVRAEEVKVRLEEGALVFYVETLDEATRRLKEALDGEAR